MPGGADLALPRLCAWVEFARCVPYAAVCAVPSSRAGPHPAAAVCSPLASRAPSPWERRLPWRPLRQLAGRCGSSQGVPLLLYGSIRCFATDAHASSAQLKTTLPLTCYACCGRRLQAGTESDDLLWDLADELRALTSVRQSDMQRLAVRGGRQLAGSAVLLLHNNCAMLSSCSKQLCKPPATSQQLS